MSDALSIQVAAAVAAEINGHAWASQPEAFTAARKYYARFDDGGLATVQVSVIALAQVDQLAARSKLQTDLTLWVDVQRAVDDFAGLSEVDGLVNLLAEIKAFFSDRHRLAAPLDGLWYQDAAYAQGEFWSPQRLYADHVFEAAVELTVRGIFP